MSHNEWRRASRHEPCPICRKTDNCTVSCDGGAVWCGRVFAASVRENSGGQFLHILRDDWNDRGWAPPTKASPSPQPKDFSKDADRGFSHPDAPSKRAELAEELGVTKASLDRLGVGWDDPQRSQGRWLIPERDAKGRVIGIATRLTGGSKKNLPGSRRGLTFADDWMERAGPVLIVEGASDTAALDSMGLAVIGTYTAGGGASMLAKLLRRIPDDRSIIVVGENDRKLHESLSESIRASHNPACEGCRNCWPGKSGAIKLAGGLSQVLCREVSWCLAPDDKKDTRAWVHSMRKERS